MKNHKFYVIIIFSVVLFLANTPSVLSQADCALNSLEDTHKVECDSAFSSNKHYEIANKHLDSTGLGNYEVLEDSQNILHGLPRLEDCCYEAVFSSFTVVKNESVEGYIQVYSDSGKAYFYKSPKEDKLPKYTRIFAFILISMAFLVIFFGVTRLLDKNLKVFFLILFIVISIFSILMFLLPTMTQYYKLRSDEKKCEECIKSNECRIYTYTGSTLKSSTHKEKKYYYYRDLTRSDRLSAKWITEDFEYVHPFLGYKGQTCGRPGGSIPCVLNPPLSTYPFNLLLGDKLSLTLVPNIIFFLCFGLYLKIRKKRMFAWPFLICIVLCMAAITLYAGTNMNLVLGNCG